MKILFLFISRGISTNFSILLRIKVSDEPTCVNPILKNIECNGDPSPELCPNSWQYLGSPSYKWKYDDQIQVECDKNVINKTHTIISMYFEIDIMKIDYLNLFYLF